MSLLTNEMKLLKYLIYVFQLLNASSPKTIFECQIFVLIDSDVMKFDLNRVGFDQLEGREGLGRGGV